MEGQPDSVSQYSQAEGQPVGAQYDLNRTQKTDSRSGDETIQPGELEDGGPLAALDRPKSSQSNSLHRRALGRTRSRISAEVGQEATMEDARSLASIDRPPDEEVKLPPAKIYHPLSPHVIALLIPASIFGALARLGLLGLTGYDGHAIFPLAWIQAAGCLVMGFGLELKEPIGQLYVFPL